MASWWHHPCCPVAVARPRPELSIHTAQVGRHDVQHPGTLESHQLSLAHLTPHAMTLRTMQQGGGGVESAGPQTLPHPSPLLRVPLHSHSACTLSHALSQSSSLSLMRMHMQHAHELTLSLMCMCMSHVRVHVHVHAHELTTTILVTSFYNLRTSTWRRCPRPDR